QRTEEILRITGVRADVVVPEHHRACRACGDFADNLVDRTVPDGRWPVEERDRAVVAAMGTASRRYRDRLPVTASLDEVPSRCGHTGERRLPARYVELLQPAAASVLEDARPRVLGFAHDYGVGVSSGLFGKSRCVRSSNHDGYAAAAKLPGEVVGVESG